MPMSDVDAERTAENMAKIDQRLEIIEKLIRTSELSPELLTAYIELLESNTKSDVEGEPDSRLMDKHHRFRIARARAYALRGYIEAMTRFDQAEKALAEYGGQ